MFLWSSKSLEVTKQTNKEHILKSRKWGDMKDKQCSKLIVLFNSWGGGGNESGDSNLLNYKALLVILYLWAGWEGIYRNLLKWLKNLSENLKLFENRVS